MKHVAYEFKFARVYKDGHVASQWALSYLPWPDFKLGFLIAQKGNKVTDLMHVSTKVLVYRPKTKVK